MHIGFLTPEYVKPGTHYGGLATYVRKVGLALGERGHQVSALVLSNQNATWKDGTIAIHEVKSVSLPSPLKSVPLLRPFLPITTQYLASRQLATLAWKLHRQTPFDILQTSNYLAPGFTLCRKSPCPLVCRVCSYAPLWRSGYGFQRRLGDHLSDWLEIRQTLDADAVFAPSEFLADVLLRFENLQVQVLRTPVDLNIGDADDSAYKADLAGLKYLLFFGTLSPLKGVDRLVGAIEPILKQYPDLHFVFVGRDDGLSNGQKVFDYLCSHNPVFRKQLHYYPPLSKVKLNPIIANALGVLMPSRADNYPNACLEAQALGIPVIGTTHSSLEEMIIENETGFLVQQNNLEDLQRAVRRLLDQSPDQRNQMQQRIRSQVDRVLQEDRISQLLSFYTSVLNEDTLID